MTQTDDILGLDDVLLDDAAGAGIADAVHGVAQSTELAQALVKVPPVLREVALGELTRAIREALHADLLEPLIGAWRRFQALTDAARRTVEQQGSEEVVNLATHEITSSVRRSIEVFVDGVKRKELRLEIDVTIDVYALIAVIVAGRLVAVRSGRADVRARRALRRLRGSPGLARGRPRPHTPARFRDPACGAAGRRRPPLAICL